MKNRKLKLALWIFGGLCSLIVLIVLACDFIVVRNASRRTFDSVEDIPHNRVALLLATSPITPGGARNFYFDNRIKAAAELYNAGKIDIIIASGGDYTKDHQNGCDEPKAIRDSLMKYGVSAAHIELDYEGTRTLCSIAKLKEVYDVDSVTLISQKYHNERAIYLADKFGISAIGYNADPSPIRRNRIKNTIREYFARPKMFIDFIVGVKPQIKSGKIALPDDNYDIWGIPKYLNSVRGHNEKAYIVGNFSGTGIDTIFIADEPLRPLTKVDRKKYGFGLVGGGAAEDDNLQYAVSNNPKLPPVELFCPNGLVFEGDVDGDGRDEWGYLYKWMTSQWRQYRIYNYDPKTRTWRHLYYGDLLDTPEYVRSSGVDLVEKGSMPGLIKINFGTDYPDYEIRDTMVRPTYTPISKDAW